ncbi:unnamed protein product [Protopolystoma xenopodis]|uniref:Uncharacterized protein n=1 Tax=Protopolystoma xenopodis TaxID=117903 RepID=A0A3S5CJL6_9PLAT|nr:unnamed protein product [Protopolystoma xenopodis]
MEALSSVTAAAMQTALPYLSVSAKAMSNASLQACFCHPVVFLAPVVGSAAEVITAALALVNLMDITSYRLHPLP